jgi:predicted transcriptional regulator
MVKDLMTDIQEGQADNHFVHMNADAGVAAELMGKYNVQQLSVMDTRGSNKKVVGIITAESILRYYSNEKRKENKYESPRRTRELMVTGRRLAKRAYRK